MDEPLVRKLAIRSLCRGIGSIDFIDSLLIMEEDQDVGKLGESSMKENENNDPPERDASNEHTESTSMSTPDWCVCGKCRLMPQEIENKCCKLKRCITITLRFNKFCLDPDVLELCIKNRADI